MHHMMTPSPGMHLAKALRVPPDPTPTISQSRATMSVSSALSALAAVPSAGVLRAGFGRRAVLRWDGVELGGLGCWCCCCCCWCWWCCCRAAFRVSQLLLPDSPEQAPLCSTVLKTASSRKANKTQVLPTGQGSILPYTVMYCQI